MKMWVYPRNASRELRMMGPGLISMPPMMSRIHMTQARIVEKARAVSDCQMESGKQQEMFKNLRLLCRPMRARHKSIDITVLQVV